MRSYELAFIIRPAAEEASVAAVEERVSQLVKSTGGEVTSVDRWGSRRLAYPIQKQREGIYVVMQLQLQPQTIVELERGLKLTEEILRYLLVKPEA
jgi:small subunit ribosomal protein S6